MPHAYSFIHPPLPPSLVPAPWRTAQGTHPHIQSGGHHRGAWKIAAPPQPTSSFYIHLPLAQPVLRRHILPPCAPRPMPCRLVDVFQGAGIPAQLVDDIPSVMWGKLVVSACINPLTALLQVPNGCPPLHPTPHDVPCAECKKKVYTGRVCL